MSFGYGTRSEITWDDFLCSYVTCLMVKVKKGPRSQPKRATSNGYKLDQFEKQNYGSRDFNSKCKMNIDEPILV